MVRLTQASVCSVTWRRMLDVEQRAGWRHRGIWDALLQEISENTAHRIRNKSHATRDAEINQAKYSHLLGRVKVGFANWNNSVLYHFISIEFREKHKCQVWDASRGQTKQWHNEMVSGQWSGLSAKADHINRWLRLVSLVKRVWVVKSCMSWPHVASFSVVVRSYTDRLVSNA